MNRFMCSWTLGPYLNALYGFVLPNNMSLYRVVYSVLKVVLVLVVVVIVLAALSHLLIVVYSASFAQLF